MKNIKRIAAVLLAVLVILATFTACASQEKQIIGAWRDSTGTTGYEFLEGNVCKITFADVELPIIGRYNGTVDNGIYNIEKKDDGNYYVTITYTLFTKSISSQYMFVVDGDTLTLTDMSDGEVTVLMAYAPADTTAAAAQ